MSYLIIKQQPTSVLLDQFDYLVNQRDKAIKQAEMLSKEPYEIPRDNLAFFMKTIMDHLPWLYLYLNEKYKAKTKQEELNNKQNHRFSSILSSISEPVVTLVTKCKANTI